MSLRIPRLRFASPPALVLAGGAVMVAALVVPVLATTQAGPLLVSVTTSPNPYAIEGTSSVANSVGILAYATGAKSVALEGYATQPDSAGLEGFASSTSGTGSNGVFGYSPNGSGVYGVGAGAVYPAVFGDDKATGGTGLYGLASGVGVFGRSLAGNGIVGQTQVATSATPGAYAGVLGSDFSSDGQSGVEGSSTQGYGVLGESGSVGTIGIERASTSAAGGTGAAGVDLAAKPGPNYVTGFKFAGVTGQSAENYGVAGTTLTTGDDNYAGVLGLDESAGDTNAGVLGTTKSGFGMLAVANASGGYGLEGEAEGTAAVGVEAYSDAVSAVALDVTAAAGKPMTVSNGDSEIMSLDANGNMILVGSLTQMGTPSTVARDAHGTGRVMYQARQTQSTLEDVGEAQMSAGRASVPLDPAFASLIDRTRPYVVFITPESPNAEGLYVAGRTLQGFEVRDNTGRTNAAFAYRIVAHPLTSKSEARLAIYRPVEDPIAQTIARKERFVRAARLAAVNRRGGSTFLRLPAAQPAAVKAPRIPPMTFFRPASR